MINDSLKQTAIYAEIARTILDQLGGKQFLVMTGARNLIAHQDGLSFRLPGPRSYAGGINYVRITLTPADTYNVTFSRVYGLKITPKASADGIYASDLRRVFTSATGLETSLGTMGRTA